MSPFPALPSLTRGWLLGLAAVTLLGLGLRLWAIDAHSFWYDEAFTQELIKRPASEMVSGDARDNGNPPLYWLVAHGWQQVAGPRDDVLRGFSALCGALAVPFLGLLGRRLLSPTAGLVAAGLYAVSPLAIEFSNEARVYALLQFLTVVNAWLFVRWLAGRRPADLIGYAVTMFLCWYSHYYAAFLPMAHLLVLACLPWDSRRWLGWVGAMAAAAVMWATWLPIFLAQLGTPGNLARSAETWQVQFLATPITYALGRTFAWRDSPKWLLAIAVVGTLTAFLIPALLGARRTWRETLPRTLLLGWLLIPIAVPLLVAVTFKPVYSHRYAAIGLPAFSLLMAAGLTALRPAPRWAVVGLLLALTATSLYRYATEPLKDDWRSATAAILAHTEPGELLVFDSASEVVAFRHYAGTTQIADTIGLDTSPANGASLPGVRERNGAWVEPVPRDRADEIFAQDRVCLVLCVPSRTPAEYQTLFRTHGFTEVRSYEFRRIHVIHFARGESDRTTRR